jgi:hypothetical protein
MNRKSSDARTPRSARIAPTSGRVDNKAQEKQ